MKVFRNISGRYTQDALLNLQSHLICHPITSFSSCAMPPKKRKNTSQLRVYNLSDIDERPSEMEEISTVSNIAKRTRRVVAVTVAVPEERATVTSEPELVTTPFAPDDTTLPPDLGSIDVKMKTKAKRYENSVGDLNFGSTNSNLLYLRTHRCLRSNNIARITLMRVLLSRVAGGVPICVPTGPVCIHRRNLCTVVAIVSVTSCIVRHAF